MDQADIQQFSKIVNDFLSKSKENDQIIDQIDTYLKENNISMQVDIGVVMSVMLTNLAEIENIKEQLALMIDTYDDLVTELHNKNIIDIDKEQPNE